MAKGWAEHSEFLIEGVKRLTLDIIRIDAKTDRILYLILGGLISVLAGLAVWFLRTG